MILDSFYKFSPRTIQNIFITGYGFAQNQLRYKTKIPEIYPLADQLNEAHLRAAQESRLKELIAHASRHVPYYRDYFRKNHIDPNIITRQNFDDLLPIIEKQDLVSDPERFYSECFKDSAIKLHTSGTSGSPLKVLCSKEARAINYWFHRKLLNENGCDVKDRKVTLAGRILFSDKESSVFWRKDYFNNTLYCSTYHLAEGSIPHYLRAIDEWRPDFIDSYPSALLTLAQFINKEKIQLKSRLKFILTSSETLGDESRHAIESAFRAKVIDQYGCTEMAVTAWQKNELYEIQPLYSLVEFLPSGDNDVSSIICTGLINFAMPLIRYKIGDTVVLSSGGDTSMPQRFSSICGREDDLIVTPEGRRIGRMDPAFKGVSGIDRAQIIQTAINHIELLVVVARGGDFKAIATCMKENIKARTSGQMLVDVTQVENIPLSKSGKFKAVISKVNQAES